MKTHTPVLQKEISEILTSKKNSTTLDATLGTGGHAKELIRDMQSGVFVGIDADAEALKQAEKVIAPVTKRVTVHIQEDNFRNIAAITKKIGITGYDQILLDLGWGSHQLESGRGFSFMQNEPLNMCYGTKEGACDISATEVINTFRENDLRAIIQTYGEERWARRIAKHIVNERKEKPIVMSKQLAEIVETAIPKRFQPKKIHAATKTFQAIRITVNDEINSLEQFLKDCKTFINPRARIAIIAFHSLEDRVVKQTFKTWEAENHGKRGTKKPTRPSEEECRRNPRARSAKLRTFTFN